MATEQFTAGAEFRARVRRLDPKDPNHVVNLAALLLDCAHDENASDIHLLPTPTALEMRWRIDGVLHMVDALPGALAKNIAARLKVLADLLTYRTDIPQEGRIRTDGQRVERRVSTFPTLHGEKVVIRLFAEQRQFQQISDLGLPEDVVPALNSALGETSGLLLIVGPAGSGKTTTLYACLRAIAATTAGARGLASIEDPIESAIDGVAQSQVNPNVGFDLAAGLRSLMRQDPEVIAIGEMRDRPTVDAALGASLTGHLVLSTFHAGSAAGAIGRMLDMGIEPYVLRSGVRAVIAQRLLRRLCACAVAEHDRAAWLGLNVSNAFRAVGCGDCNQTGYRGRFLLAELFSLENRSVAAAVLARSDVGSIESVAAGAGMRSLFRRACESVEAGVTSAAEVRRIFGDDVNVG